MVHAQFGDVGCWKERCRKTILCDVCPELCPGSPLVEPENGFY
jgi:hypothetical protein